jgi:hypothetical protein
MNTIGQGWPNPLSRPKTPVQEKSQGETDNELASA